MVTYVNYVAGTTKGETRVEDLFNNPFMLGDVAADGTRKEKIDSRYTSNAVVEPVETFTSGTTAVAFTPVEGSVRLLDANGVQVDDADGEHPATFNAETGVITQTSFKADKSASDVKKIAYFYDNIIIPQKTLPTLKAEMKSIPLIARARRIAIYYSQIAAFQSKTDYGLDLGDQLAQQAVGRLQYEIDKLYVA